MTSPRRVFLAAILGILIISAIGAFRWARSRRSLLPKPIAQSETRGELRNTPPFETKEPERYQAVRIVTSVEYQDGKAVTTISKTAIARDGDQRREEYDSGSDKAVVYLESSAGRFVISPAAKIYAEINAANAEADGADASTGAADFSPDLLLHETPVLARYENLGNELIDGRTAEKYRVTSTTAGNDSVTIIWIDKALGLPLRSETSSTGGDHPATLTIELRELTQQPDAKIFALPSDFRKVDYPRFFSESGVSRRDSGN